MKKLYFLFTLLVSTFTFSQGSINFDDATKWSATTPTSYGNHIYTDGSFTATGVDVIRNTTTAQDVFAGALGTYSFRLRDNGTTNLTMTIASGGVGNFTFKARRWDAAPATNFTVEYSTDGGTNWTTSSTINASVTTDSDWKNINGIVNSSNANVKIRIKSNGTTERIMIDDFAWTAPTTDPTLVISSPSNGSIYSPITTSANISLSISNFIVGNPGAGIDGHIHYTVNGAQTMKYDTTPIALTGLTPGTYVVVVTLVDNNNTAIVPAVNATVTFTIAAYNVVANLAALRADVVANGQGKYYQVSSNPVVTYTRVIRNQKYVQDTSGGILIDDNVTAPGVITTSLTAGDAISGLKGQASLFNGLLQLLPIADVTRVTSNNTITPQVVTIAELNNATAILAGTYESELVQINGVTFDTTTANFPASTATAANINLTIGSDVLTFRTAFSEANYMGTTKPTGSTNIIALVGRYDTSTTSSAQVTSRSTSDLNVPLSSSSFDNINGLTMYPNPLSGNTLYLTSSANAAMSVQIFDLLGKEVMKANVVNNAVNVAKLTAGVYVVKITEDGKTATRKLVIK
jgi:hypothetical protein